MLPQAGRRWQRVFRRDPIIEGKEEGNRKYESHTDQANGRSGSDGIGGFAGSAAEANEVLVKIAATGVNFIDVYNREGRYKAALPLVLGQEAAGEVSAIGSDVHSVAVGDRVAYTMSLGSYAEYAAVPAERLVKIPAGVSERDAAAAILQGMTAHYLVYDTYPLKKGETALVHAAAGGVGLLLAQMAHNLGARVIATVSTEEKAKLARGAGADDVILYTQVDFETETKNYLHRRRQGR